MAVLSVYEPPMCCSTGVCGPDEPDSALAQFASDLDWLQARGWIVERYNLSQSPAAFAGQPAVLRLLQREQAAALPAFVLDGQIVHKGDYPTREQMSAWAEDRAEAARQAAAVTSPTESAVERARIALSEGRAVVFAVRGAAESVADNARALVSESRYSDAVDLVELSRADRMELQLIREIAPDADNGSSPIILVVPPGIPIGYWETLPEKAEDLEAALDWVLSRCQPGGGCCG